MISLRFVLVLNQRIPSASRIRHGKQPFRCQQTPVCMVHFRYLTGECNWFLFKKTTKDAFCLDFFWVLFFWQQNP